MKDPNICTRKKCTFYGNERTGTCNYLTMTNRRRGCPVKECDKFTTAKYKDKRSHLQVSVWQDAPNHNKEKKDMAKYNWEIILKDYLETGRPAKELSEKYGPEITQINRKIREWKIANDIPVKTRGKSDGAPSAPGKIPAPPVREKRMGNGKDKGAAENKWYLEDIRRMLCVADGIPPDAPYSLYMKAESMMAQILKEMFTRKLTEIKRESEAQGDADDENKD